jgi:Ca2+-transporting ATPase
MKEYACTKEELIEYLNSHGNSGLNTDFAENRLKEEGRNKLDEAKKQTKLQRFFNQFKDVMIIILLIAALVSFIVTYMEGGGKGYFEPILILLIVILNAAIGVAQESKAEAALDALKNLSSPKTRVIRDGTEKIISAEELVRGDLIVFEAGDKISADARLISSASLKSEESALTGESVPSDKDANLEVQDKAPLADRDNMIYSGCSITYGSGKAIVTSTGMNTEIGKIATLLSSEKDMQTPLQLKLAKLGKNLGFMALIACAVIFVLGIVDGLDVLEIFMTAVSLAVSAIPEGLPAIVTVVLSIGVQRMVKKNAVIRKLPAVETLGSASIICSDKTGTLTQNRMTLTKAYLSGANDAVDLKEKRSEEIKKLINFGTVCSNGNIEVERDSIKYIGDPTETSIVYASYENGYTKKVLNGKHKRILELPFDSDRKLMTTVNEMDGKYIVIVKGAYDELAKKCISGDLDKAKHINDELSSKALRIIAIATKVIDELPNNPTFDSLESELDFAGLLGMIDPPRPEVIDSVTICKEAGIKAVMITGDHVVTASAIASELGILNDGEEAITGTELDEMDENEFLNRIRNISVYARVSPENKIRIVKAWQSLGEVVSMTGDGVNDAPALKAADIGCAMGITGTDVSKDASDMILTDDNFSTIVDAIREGRGIYDNIRKVVGFLLGTNIGEVLTVFIAMLLWRITPLLPMQLLWINLVTDSLPAIALGMEAVEDDVMSKSPRPKSEGIFAHGLGIRVFLQGGMFAILSLIAYSLGNEFGGATAGQTMTFMVLALSQVLQSYNMRSHFSLFKIGFFTNKKLNYAALLSLAMVLLVLLTPLSIPFGMTALTFTLYLKGLGLAIVPIIVIEIAKALGLVKA